MTPAPASEEFRTVNQLFGTEIIGKRNFGALDLIYTADATILPPGAPMITGRENIRGFWQEALKAMNPTGGGVETISLKVDGDTAVEIGRATIESAGPAVEVKYLVVWKREDGSWKWHIDIWNTNS